MKFLERVFEAFSESGAEGKIDGIKISRVPGFSDGIGLQTDLANGIIRLFVWPSFDRAWTGGKDEPGLVLVHSIRKKDHNRTAECLEIHNNFESCTKQNRFSDEHRELCARVLIYADALRTSETMSCPE